MAGAAVCFGDGISTDDEVLFGTSELEILEFGLVGGAFTIMHNGLPLNASGQIVTTSGGAIDHWLQGFPGMKMAQS